MADGGEGTLDALLAVWGGAPETVATVDAIGRPAQARWAMSPDGRTAVVELAEASGPPRVSDVALQPLPPRPPRPGRVARAARDAGGSEILLCVGGAASRGGGAGILTGLGARLLDAEGRDVPDGGEGLAAVTSLDLGGLHPRAREVRWRLAVDVTNPLVGELGAAHVFGPQKGARDGVADYLDDALRHWAEGLEVETGRAVAALP